MTAITIGHATATVQGAKATPAKPKSGLMARAWKAFVESRMQQAEREIAMHRHLLPAELQNIDDRLARGEKGLPFVR